MKRFFAKILLVSLFFTGLGAIAESVLNELFIAKTESRIKQIRIIRIERSSTAQVQMILPSFENENRVR